MDINDFWQPANFDINIDSPRQAIKAQMNSLFKMTIFVKFNWIFYWRETTIA